MPAGNADGMAECGVGIGEYGIKGHAVRPPGIREVYNVQGKGSLIKGVLSCRRTIGYG